MHSLGHVAKHVLGVLFLVRFKNRLQASMGVTRVYSRLFLCACALSNTAITGFM